MICPNCGDDMALVTVEVGDGWNDGEADEWHCPGCGDEYPDYSLCHNCSRLIPIMRLGASSYCSNKCRQVYEEGA